MTQNSSLFTLPKQESRWATRRFRQARPRACAACTGPAMFVYVVMYRCHFINCQVIFINYRHHIILPFDPACFYLFICISSLRQLRPLIEQAWTTATSSLPIYLLLKSSSIPDLVHTRCKLDNPQENGETVLSRTRGAPPQSHTVLLLQILHSRLHLNQLYVPRENLESGCDSPTPVRNCCMIPMRALLG